ncbi:Uncharacterised protein [Lactobacillus acidophilus]|uniref:ABC transporter permease n=1 Tax=Lactobacillus crispatus TaxID=47770 RepID=A0AAW8WNP0_9LACO|nr:hypothetical protein [Lactobacillus crispatus]MDT9617543.1 hypothetical protein [Lactobacillus crispatus]STX18460.1 Uncharacterised protein [Lactobacillus acidophilus]
MITNILFVGLGALIPLGITSFVCIKSRHKSVDLNILGLIYIALLGLLGVVISLIK